MKAWLISLLLILIASPLWAQEGGQTARASTDIMSAGYLLQVFLSLAVVIGLMFGMLWVLRRFNAVGPGLSGDLRVLASVSLGQRERAVLVAAGEQQILLGVAPGSVRTLHVFDEPILDVNAKPASVNFGDVWKQVAKSKGSEA